MQLLNDLVALSMLTGVRALTWVASSSACKTPMVGLALIAVAALKILVTCCMFYFYGVFLSSNMNLDAWLADALAGEMVAPLRSLNCNVNLFLI